RGARPGLRRGHGNAIGPRYRPGQRRAAAAVERTRRAVARQRHKSRRHDGRSAEGSDGRGRHPAGLRQGVGRRRAPLPGARRMKPPNEAALDAFLGLITEKGFAAVSLRDVAAAASLGLAELYRIYPDKAALMSAFTARIDRDVLAGTQAQLDPEETVRDRLFDVMMRRYDALRPHRQ